MLLLVQILEHNPVVGLDYVTTLVVEVGIPQVVVFRLSQQDLAANDEAVGADHCVRVKEREEVLVVVKADTLVDPHAVVVELLHAEAAHGTVFRPCGLLDFASSALLALLKDEIVVLEAFEGREYFTSITRLVEPTRVHIARHEVGSVAD